MINRVEKHNTNTKYKYTYKNAILFSFYLLPNTYIFLFQKFFHNLYLISPSVASLGLLSEWSTTRIFAKGGKLGQL